MSEFPEFFAITLIGAMMIISPGPDFALVVRNSLVFGRQTAVLSSVGIAIANLCHVTINLLGIGLIISQSIVLFTVLKVLGACYLLFIGFKSLRAKAESKLVLESPSLPAQEDRPENRLKNEKIDIDTTTNLSLSKSFMSGFLTSLLNPKACLFFLSFFSVILSAATPFFIQLGYGVWLSFMALVWFCLVSIFFTNPKLSEKLKQCKHWIERFTGGVLMIFGFKLLTSKF